MSALSTLAASMAVGDIEQLAQTNITGMFATDTGGSILQYANRALWNPINQTIMMQGAAHTGGSVACDSSKMVRWADSSNTWSVLQDVCEVGIDRSNSQNIGHIYNHDDIDTATGDLYHRNYGSGTWSRFIHASQTWQARTAITNLGSYQVAGAVSYFPDRASFVFVDGDWGMQEYVIATNSWTQKSSGIISGGNPPQLVFANGYHNLSEYLPAGPCVIFGGGSGVGGMFRFNVDGSLAAIANAPSGVDLSIPQGSPAVGAVLTRDPVSGTGLAWNTAGTGYEYTPSTDSWAATGHNLPFVPTGDGGIANVCACPVDDYGVIVFLVHDSSSEEVWVYKRTASEAPPSTLIWVQG